MKIIVLFLSICMLIVCSACNSDSKDDNPAGPEPVISNLPWLHTEGNKIVDENGTMMILRGVNRSGLEYDKNGTGISREEIDFICQDWKAQIIRIPFNQEWIMNDQAYNNFLDQVVGWIISNDAYVLLDLQWQNTTVQIPPIPDEEAIDMWKILAARYKNNSGVLYDIHNEAHDTSWEAWRARASEIIEGIRSVHDKALIFVSGLDWAYDLRGWGQQPLPYTNIVYSTHPYPFKGEPWAWDKYFGDYVDDFPVFAGEFGGSDDDLTWGRQLLAYFNGKKMGWTAWSWSNQPYLTEPDRRTATAFGNLVRSALIQHATGDTSLIDISDIQVLYISADKATVTWKTNLESDSKVRYGTSTAYSDSVSAPALLTSHSIKLQNLQSATTYHFIVESQDLYGNIAVSSDSTFQTLASQ